VKAGLTETELDEAILAALEAYARHHPTSTGPVAFGLGGLVGQQKPVLTAIRRRLQTLRKQGRIECVDGSWRLAGSSST
jgi:predicted ATP-dependent serine protease